MLATPLRPPAIRLWAVTAYTLIVPALTLGQPLIIENVGGANGSIGVGRVARSRGDGYTLVLGLWNTAFAERSDIAYGVLAFDIAGFVEGICGREAVGGSIIMSICPATKSCIAGPLPR
jgi:Tripartite tricarboxylate transporter family receptor